MTELEKAFHEAMMHTYRVAKSELGYNAAYFLQMVSQHGGVEAAHTLLRSTNKAEGFTRLWLEGRLDLSVEATALKPEFAPLFTEEELNEARRRLDEVNYQY